MTHTISGALTLPDDTTPLVGTWYVSLATLEGAARDADGSARAGTKPVDTDPVTGAASVTLPDSGPDEAYVISFRSKAGRRRVELGPYQVALAGNMTWSQVISQPLLAPFPESALPAYLDQAQLAAAIAAGAAAATYGPLDAGFSGWAYDPATCASNTALGSTTMNGARVKALDSRTVTNLWAHVGVAGAGLTKVVMGLYDSAGNLLASTSDQSAAFQSVGSKACPLTAGVPVVAGRSYYLLFVQVGATPASIARTWSSGGNNSGNAGVAQPNLRFVSLGSGLQAMPAAFDPQAVGASSAAYWFGMS